MVEMVILREIRDEIKAAVVLEDFNRYFEEVRRWLKKELTIEEFDKIAQNLVPNQLHTKFLIALVTIFDNKIKTYEKKELTDFSNNIATSSKYNPLDWSSLRTKTVAGWLPDCNIIRAWAYVIAMNHDLEDVDDDIPNLVYQHVYTIISNIFEAVLKMSRSFMCTETGFTHSYGVQKLDLSNISTLQNSNQSVRCILPSRHKITPQDLLDCFDLECDLKYSNSLVPNMTLKSRLLKRLEIAADSVEVFGNRQLNISSQLCSSNL